MVQKLNRRDFLRISALSAAGIVATACAKTPTEAPAEPTASPKPAEPTATPKPAEPTKAPEPAGPSAQQAPMLSDEVAAGNLPDLAERMPAEPAVIEPLEEVGKYGGTWRRASDFMSLNNRRASEGLLHFGRDATTLELNLAQEWEATADGTTFTFYLRKGGKWSSGDTFSVDDIMFWYEDILLNEEMTPTPPKWWRPGQEVGKVEKVDDYTVRFAFDAPHGTLPDQMPFSAYSIVTYPKEYLKQFHPNYADKAELDKMISDRGFEQWFQLLGDRRNWDRNPDYPVNGPWKTTSEDWTTHQIADRNPYYFKADPEGKQLPYIDKIVSAVTSPEMIPMKIVGGEVDKQAWSTAISNYTLYMENKEKGDYEVYIWNYGTSATSMHVNIARQVEEGDAAGQEKRELLANRDFRIALSKAIDRDQLNTLNYKGLAAPAIELFPESVQQDPEIQALFEYDPDEANRILDDLGLTERDSEGMRLMPSGETLNLLMAGHIDYAVHLDVAEVVSGFWREVGIRGTPDPIAGEMWWPLVAAGDVDVVAYEVDYTAGNKFWLTYPRAFFPVESSTYWAPRYGNYYVTGGSDGEEGPADIKKMQDLYGQCLVTLDLEQRKALTDEAFRMCAYNLWPIPTLASRPEPCIVKHGFRNVPEYGLMAYPVRGEKTTKPEQYFWDNL